MLVYTVNRGILAVFGVAVFFAILFGSLTFESVMAAPADKVDVCHVDPDGDGAGLETISIKDNKSVSKHEAHGDHVGACFVCGDTFTDFPVESCDDGANNGTPGFCNAVCDGTEPAVCGDDILTPPETCDDGANNGTPGFCNAVCDGTEPAPFCGDGIVDPGEQCDDGNNTNADGCTSACVAEVCGDGIINNLPFEQCDDGNTVTEECDYGDTSCFVCDATCTLQDGASYCGDNVIDEANGETCDDGANNGSDTFCNSACTGLTEYCGDNIVNNGEECDGSDLNDMSCSDYMFNAGDLSCDSICEIDSTACYVE